MESISVGWLSILPPIIAIVLALLTREVIFSLLTGILIGAFIYSINMGLNPFTGTLETTFDVMINSVHMDIIIFCSLLGSLIYVISMAGASNAYGKWATTKIKSKKGAMLSTLSLGGLIFIDDYFNCLTVGTVMQPVTDKYKVSRARLAYIIDSIAAPVCIIVPISSWGAAVGSSLSMSGAFTSDFAAFVATIPFNFYALLTIILVILLSAVDFSFGSMRTVEKKAENGDIGIVENNSEQVVKSSDKGKVFDMLIPICSLIVFSILGMLYNGGYFGDDPAYHSIAAAFGNCDAAQALVWGSFGSLVVSLILFVPRRLMTFSEFMKGINEGVKTMVGANIILILAWSISTICGDLLQTGSFMSELVVQSNIPAALLPAIIFLFSSFLSFAIGTAWGAFGILIPIVVSVVSVVAPELLIVSLSATLAGSVFGDHCSPISDTSILSSIGAGCDHLEHVYTQLPYALLTAACSFIGYIIAGFTNANVWISLISSLVLMLLSVFAIHLYINNKDKAITS